jgi:5-amino-6-(5-phosphoribosylamino)uracil reductase
VADRPYTLLSRGLSLDDYLDSPTTRRLALSNAADFERSDAVRAASDAILVGAATVRNDNPRRLVRSPASRRDRVGRGLAPSPAKVTVTASGRLDPRGQFFTAGRADKLVYWVPTGLYLTEANAAYLATKARRGGHDQYSPAFREIASSLRVAHRGVPSEQFGRVGP